MVVEEKSPQTSRTNAVSRRNRSSTGTVIREETQTDEETIEETLYSINDSSCCPRALSSSSSSSSILSFDSIPQTQILKRNYQIDDLHACTHRTSNQQKRIKLNHNLHSEEKGIFATVDSFFDKELLSNVKTLQSIELKRKTNEKLANEELAQVSNNVGENNAFLRAVVIENTDPGLLSVNQKQESVSSELSNNVNKSSDTSNTIFLESGEASYPTQMVCLNHHQSDLYLRQVGIERRLTILEYETKFLRKELMDLKKKNSFKIVTSKSNISNLKSDSIPASVQEQMKMNESKEVEQIKKFSLPTSYINLNTNNVVIGGTLTKNINDDNIDVGYLRPTENDVVSGRGHSANNHQGNKKYINLVKKYKRQYIQALTDFEKTRICSRVINEIRNSGRRFLKRIYGKSQVQWVEMEANDVKKKVSQAMRDNAYLPVPVSEYDTKVSNNASAA